MMDWQPTGTFADYLRTRLHGKLRAARGYGGEERQFHMTEARRLARLLRQYQEPLR